MMTTDKIITYHGLNLKELCKEIILLNEGNTMNQDGELSRLVDLIKDNGYPDNISLPLAIDTVSSLVIREYVK